MVWGHMGNWEGTVSRDDQLGTEQPTREAAVLEEDFMLRE